MHRVCNQAPTTAISPAQLPLYACSRNEKHVAGQGYGLPGAPVSSDGRSRGATAAAAAGQLPSPAWKRAGLTLEDRVARGKAARAGRKVAHGRWEPAVDRPDPVPLLLGQAESRVPELRPDPATGGCSRSLAGHFLPGRGRDHERASRPWLPPRSRCSSSGDAGDLSNFGVFGSPERQLIFYITTSTRRSPARGSGMSNGWPRASRSQAVTLGSACTARPARCRCWPRSWSASRARASTVITASVLSWRASA